MPLIQIKPHEKKPALLLLLMFFAVVSASITGAAVRDAVFLIQFDKSYLPLMFVAVAITVAFIIPLYKKWTNEKDIVSVITLSGLLFSLSLFFLHQTLEGYFIPILYVWIEIITILSILQFWMLAGEIFNPRQAKRLFTLIGAGGSFAGIGSGYGIKPFIGIFGSENLLFLTIIFLGCMVILAQSLRPFRQNQSQPVHSENSQSSKTTFDPYLKSIAIMIGLSAFISKIIDYQFKMMAAESFPVQHDLVNFFGTYYMSTGAATLVMQFFITGFILARFSILAGLLVLPISLAIGSSGFLALGTLSAVFFAKFSDQVFKFSTHNTVQEILWLPVSKQKKKATKPMLDGTIRSGLEGLAGILIFGLVSLNLVPTDKIHWLSLSVIIGTIFWVWNSLQLKKGYVSSLMHAIDYRQLDLVDIEFDIQNPHIVQTIDQALLDENEHKQLFALELLKAVPLHPWKKSLNHLFESGSGPIQLEVLKLTWDHPSILSNEVLTSHSSQDPDIISNVILCASHRGIESLISECHKNLTHDSVDIATASAIAILKNDHHNQEASSILYHAIEQSNEKDLLTRLSYLNHCPDFLDDDHIQHLLFHESFQVRQATLFMIKLRKTPPNLDWIIHQLESPAIFSTAMDVLLSSPSNIVLSQLIEKLSNNNITIRHRCGIIKGLSFIHSKRSITEMLRQMNHTDLLVLNACANSLIRLSKNVDFPEEHFAQIDDRMGQIAKLGFQLYAVKKSLIDDNKAQLVLDQIDHDLGNVIPILLKLGTLKDPNIPIETYIRYVKSHDKELMPIVLELVDSTFSSENRKLTMPLIDPDMDQTQIGPTLFDDLMNREDFIFTWTSTHQSWKKALSIQYLISHENVKYLKQVDWSIVKDGHFDTQYFNGTECDYISRNFTDVPKIHPEETPMYSILEKTLILKSVDLFQSIPGDVLKQIAQIAEEMRIEKNQLIFSEGDHGDSMFVIISGKVDIRQKETSITTLGPDSCIGEMALLDLEPRSADATTLEESILLKIHQEGFYQLMASNPEIMKQIVKMLTQRVRDMNEKLTGSQQ